MPSNKTVLICAAAASGSVLLAVAGLWLYRRRKITKNPTKPEELTKPVATIEKLWIYPLKSAYRVEINEIECSVRGFKHDRLIITLSITILTPFIVIQVLGSY